MMYVNLVEGEYCPRTTKTCIGEACRDHKDNCCQIYFRSSNNSRKGKKK